MNEWSTMLTDFILAVFGLFLAVRLLRLAGGGRQKAVWFWAAAFVVTVAAAVVGGFYHGFALTFEETTRTILWKATVYLLGLMSFCMLSAIIWASASRRLRPWLLTANGVKFLAYAVGMATRDDFRYVIYDYATAMFTVVVLQAHAAFARRERSAPWIIAGVFVSFAAAGVQQSGFSLHERFNHNDLYHTIQMIALYLFYKGGRLFKDRQ